MKKIWLVIGLASAVMVTGAGCASRHGGRTYSRGEALAPQSVNYGTLMEIEEVMIEGTKTAVGTIAGGLLGGVLGHSVGGGSGKDIATVGGAVAGAAAGSAVEEAVTKQKAYAMTVRLDSGETYNYVQAKGKGKDLFSVGQRVKVLGNPRSRNSRVMPAPGAPAPTPPPTTGAAAPTEAE